MFKVKMHSEFEVYAVKKTFFNTYFLFYINGSWQWRNSKWYKPLESD